LHGLPDLVLPLGQAAQNPVDKTGRTV
jgi:hypothetical protein